MLFNCIFKSAIWSLQSEISSEHKAEEDKFH